ncbi:MAG TPA: biosynthetic arginine decarboxylase [Thermoanaerobaculia bacterium]|jgi:arginine decarboxylase|nr:biosynthetic arginine decarboxylase [Thermoanaerobaculia bacterium]MDI9631276.1 biosynthetic arginine decarboxylase [Acidobacteriota bacterium]OQC40968.1 MAG: Biosynthetic arginine decarboxylase [Acidobacteria bacterium ADurb.Bin051]MBP7812045.1 biosynthetic arginine decarboxylase [Thermoanaerobaculia bacterium]MBP8844627.1 biosynthetic arginine decarboxylase [Thermoanaerobaculia bacterium]
MATNGIPRRWTVEDSLDLYNIRLWGNDHFSVNPKGNIQVHPEGPGTPAIDLRALVEETLQRGIGLPLLIRFSEILGARVRELNEAFRRAMEEYEYQGVYRGVFPIKVNQERYVVEKLVEAGRPYHFGLEAGSKPELLAVMAMLDDDEALIVCNGYKDEEYVETALFASKLGRKVILVVEKASELELIACVAERLGVRPRIGLRARLTSRGSGHWETSGGDRSKFGLGARDLFEAVGFLRERGLLESLQLLHFHLGSQVSSIRAVKEAVREAGRIYVELVKLGAPMGYLDVGGGLGIDYDGSQTNFPSSMNYTLQEYVNDVVFGVMSLCEQASVAHPTLVSESGRALVAHHAVLVVDVLGVGEFRVGQLPDSLPEDAPLPLHHLFDTHREVSRKNLLESYHDALGYRDECLSLFLLNHLSLEQRVLAEDLFWSIVTRVLRLTRELPELPEELEGLERALADTYFCNFSIFQSLPDAWAIDQLFPIVPIHRLDEEPTRRGVIADITCDSDGKIEHFIDRRDVKSVLELHPLTDEPYYLGIFLGGAYQEILGDLHNLFGDTNTLHVSLGEDGDYHIDGVLEGDSVTEVLTYVSYDRNDLVARLRRAAERALRARQLTLDDSKQLLRMYEQGLAGYTYLESE